jgi:thiol:disulfide interchange protein DsbC
MSNPVVVFPRGLLWLGLLLGVPALPALAGQPLTTDITPADREAATAALSRLAPQLSVQAVRRTPMSGVLEVEAGGELLYLSEDGRHLLQGSLIDTVARVDLTEARRKQQRRDALGELSEHQVVRFEAEAPQHRVTVFTALECGYCKRFHSQIQDYLEAGISVDYVLIPMRGEGSEADLNGARLYCATDRQDAFTRATAGQRIEGPMCESGYAEGKALAGRLGIRNTPSIVLADGSVSGYLDVPQLEQQLDRLAQASAPGLD